MNSRIWYIIKELKQHLPFTAFGAFTGLILMLVFKGLSHEASHKLFYIFHPAHVLLSAMVTSAMYIRHSKSPKFYWVLIIGFIGSVGIATLSDSLIPYTGELLLGMHAHKHIGFIEGWYIVNPAAVLGVLIAYFWSRTKFPHAGHVLLSTWASSFHILMAMSGQLSEWQLVGSFIFLFLAVWLPCCVSDIIFPLILVKRKSFIDESI